MEASNKVIAFRSPGKTPYIAGILNNNVPEEAVTVQQEEALVKKAMDALDDMEELWEIDHCAVELRDKIHLLRYYLKNIHK